MLWEIGLMQDNYKYTLILHKCTVIIQVNISTYMNYKLMLYTQCNHVDADGTFFLLNSAKPVRYWWPYTYIKLCWPISEKVFHILIISISPVTVTFVIRKTFTVSIINLLSLIKNKKCVLILDIFLLIKNPSQWSRILLYNVYVYIYILVSQIILAEFCLYKYSY